MNTRGVDGLSQPSDLPTISPSVTPLGFEPVTSALIPLVRPQALLTLLKEIACRKGAYPTLIVHSPQAPMTNTRGVDGRGQSSDLPTYTYIYNRVITNVLKTEPDRLVRPVQPSTSHHSGPIQSFDRIEIEPELNRSNRQFNW